VSSRDGRLSVLVVAGARTSWSTAVARWAAGAVLPVEVVRCVSAGEVRARLGAGRPWSALLADAATPGVDRDLVATAREADCPTVLVDEVGGRDLTGLGAVATIGAPFSRDELLELLETHGRRVAPGRVEVVPAPERPADGNAGTLVAVLGPGGTGTSTVAAALAQGLAAPSGRRRRDPVAAPGRDVLLADLCRRADQATLHDARTFAPGLREVVDAHRTATPPPAALRDQTFAVDGRGYHLLLGLRRPHHWTALPPRAVDATLDGLLAAFEIVVADLDPDLEGEADSGSFDVEERHHLTRAAVARADLVVVTGDPSTLGCAKLVRTVAEVLAQDVDPGRLLLVCNRAPRSPRARAEVARALGDLLAAAVGPPAARIAAPLALPERPVDGAVRDAAPLPAPLPGELATAVTALLERTGVRVPAPVPTPVPVPARPGELGLVGSDDVDAATHGDTPGHAHGADTQADEEADGGHDGDDDGDGPPGWHGRSPWPDADGGT
jgi:hypothetical protein